MNRAFIHTKTLYNVAELALVKVRKVYIQRAGETQPSLKLLTEFNFRESYSFSDGSRSWFLAMHICLTSKKGQKNCAAWVKQNVLGSAFLETWGNQFDRKSRFLHTWRRILGEKIGTFDNFEGRATWTTIFMRFLTFQVTEINQIWGYYQNRYGLTLL